LAAVCNRAALAALRRAVQQSKSDEALTQLTVSIEQYDFDDVISEMFGDETFR
jgi:transitional endoplasmic reticulum ATPase